MGGWNKSFFVPFRFFLIQYLLNVHLITVFLKVYAGKHRLVLRVMVIGFMLILIGVLVPIGHVLLPKFASAMNILITKLP